MNKKNIIEIKNMLNMSSSFDLASFVLGLAILSMGHIMLG